MYSQSRTTQAPRADSSDTERHDDSESRPFLADTEKQQDINNGKNDTTANHIRPRNITASRWTLLHIGLVLIYTTIFALATLRSLTRSLECSAALGQWTTSSPAREAIQYEARPVDGLATGSIYAGYPSAESDAAWGKLLQGINLRVLPSEAEATEGFESLELRDGSGYLGVLGVYHELHCIKRLRKWIYKDYYYPNMTAEEYHERETHADHCLEFARQSAMCHGDTTMTGFKWLHDSTGRVVEPTTREGALHQCVNWEKLSSWAQDRRVNLFDPDLLVPENEDL